MIYFLVVFLPICAFLAIWSARRGYQFAGLKNIFAKSLEICEADLKNQAFLEDARQALLRTTSAGSFSDADDRLCRRLMFCLTVAYKFQSPSFVISSVYIGSGNSNHVMKINPSDTPIIGGGVFGAKNIIDEEIISGRPSEERGMVPIAQFNDIYNILVRKNEQEARVILQAIQIITGNFDAAKIFPTTRDLKRYTANLFHRSDLESLVIRLLPALESSVYIKRVYKRIFQDAIFRAVWLMGLVSNPVMIANPSRSNS